MNYNIGIDKTSPLYMQIYEMVRNDIVSGVYKYGDKLPSKRVVSDKLGVSVITVQHAYELLCDEGYVESKEKSGFFVIYYEDDFYKNPDNEGSKQISHAITNTQGVGEVSFDMFARTMRRTISEYGEGLLVKSPNQGLEELRIAISNYLARNVGISVGKEQIVVGAGAEYLYSLIAQLFLECDVIAVEKPSYDMITKVYESLGHVVDPLELAVDGIKSSELARTRAKLLHVTPFHSFPSGISASISKKKEYIKWTKEGRYIIEDNYDSELTVSMKMEDTCFKLASGKRVIYINTFSKTITPSLRVGYMILPEDMVEEYNRKLGFYSCTVPVFEQYVITQFLNSGEFERHINRVRRRLRKEL